MTSDFIGARAHLERAQRCLCGADEQSIKMRQAIDLLIEAVITAEYRQQPTNVIPFPRMIKYHA